MRKRVAFISLLAVMMLSSCSSQKKFVYLADMKVGEGYPFDTRHEAVVHRDDRLSITVSCKSPELALPFNMAGGLFQMSSDGNVNAVSTEAAVSKEKGYRVDSDGNIEFPILGTLHVEGMTVSDLTEMIKKKIVDGNYIKEPLVSIEFLNFKYTVLGAVGSNGTYTVNGDRITLLEAIANARDLSVNARIDRVAVIREVGDERVMFMHDLHSKDIFDSPCFYLQQNDIVYVEPKYKKRDAVDNVVRYSSIFMGLVSLATTIYWIVK
ncbi:MAG: polysaccharide biosynthesis/export family protein [Bacteroides sp.]|nr:polysaccharide biosynthesis/export family protein [Roseburia sp.]MCM1346002.1 polysaccharide biosynthesis/export family protein [Bacteroides sp.]MCM1420839.1 polysaccharide biosynthesis/export family protein [Bacteroides sp.]